MATVTGKTREQELAASKEAVLGAYDKLLEAKEHFRCAAEAAGVDIKQEATEQLLKGRAKTEELGNLRISPVCSLRAIERPGARKIAQ